jgi:hypothetical protein
MASNYDDFDDAATTADAAPKYTILASVRGVAHFSALLTERIAKFGNMDEDEVVALMLLSGVEGAKLWKEIENSVTDADVNSESVVVYNGVVWNDDDDAEDDPDYDVDGTD